MIRRTEISDGRQRSREPEPRHDRHPVQREPPDGARDRRRCLRAGVGLCRGAASSSASRTARRSRSIERRELGGIFEIDVQELQVSAGLVRLSRRAAVFSLDESDSGQGIGTS